MVWYLKTMNILLQQSHAWLYYSQGLLLGASVTELPRCITDTPIWDSQAEASTEYTGNFTPVPPDHWLCSTVTKTVTSYQSVPVQATFHNLSNLSISADPFAPVSTGKMRHTATMMPAMITTANAARTKILVCFDILHRVFFLAQTRTLWISTIGCL